MHGCCLPSSYAHLRDDAGPLPGNLAIKLSASSEFQTKKRLVNNDHNPGFA
jgi:hypothetical protein